jgi:hypothetical protein
MGKDRWQKLEVWKLADELPPVLGKLSSLTDSVTAEEAALEILRSS